MRPFTFITLCGLQLLAHAATVRFAIDVTVETRAPDGYARPQILVNGTSPGPALNLRQGDCVEFLVRNHLKDATAVHFHGIEQRDTPWSDGVPGLSQKPIPPGASFLYRWTATDYGTYFYHAHLKSQISDGFFGSIYIQPAESVPKPFHLINKSKAAQKSMKRAEREPNMVLVSDWTHVTAAELMDISARANLDIYCTQSILINGRGRVNCLSEEQYAAELFPPFAGLLNGTKLLENGCLPFIPLSQGMFEHNFSAVPEPLIHGCKKSNTPLKNFNVDPKKRWASFNFVSATSIHAPIVSIDNHPMWLYAVDGIYVEPVKVDAIQMFNGERYSVMVELNQRPGIYKMRANNFGLNQIISGFGTMTYRTSGGRKPVQRGKPYIKYGGVPANPTVTLLNHTSQIAPYRATPVSKTADEIHILHARRAGGAWIWTLSGGDAYPLDYASDQPMLFFPNSTLAQDESKVLRTGKNGTWVDIIFVVDFTPNDLAGPPHSMHKHSNKGYLLGTGVGNWTWNTVEEAAAERPELFNFVNPPLRDTFTTPPMGGQSVWLAMRYQVVNPGAFLIHCHIQTHFAGGMGIAVLDAIDEVPKIPMEYLALAGASRT